MNDTCHLLILKGVLNTYLPRETDNRWTKYPSSMGRKRTTDRQIQTGLIGKHIIGRNKIGLIGIH